MSNVTSTNEIAKKADEIRAAERAELERLRAEKKKLQERTAKYGERQRARTAIFVAKAKRAGITVTEAEIEKYLAENK